jgi:hypothetical protein
MCNIRHLLFVAIAISRLTLTAPVHAQTIPNDQAWRPHRWDAAHGVLFLGKDVVLRKTGPPLRSYSSDGSQRGADINLFKDFPDLEKAKVDDFAAGPAGTTVIAAELIYSPRLVNRSLLTYDLAGALRSAVDIAPYWAEAIATDEEGNIFVLGESEDEREGDPPYPLLIEYDPSGNILARAIYSNVFKDGSDAIQFFGRGEEKVSASVMLEGGTCMFMPLTRRWFWFAPSMGRLFGGPNWTTCS